MKYIYKFTVRSVGDRPDGRPAIIVYQYDPEIYHFQYTDTHKVKTIYLPHFVNNVEVSEICRDCNMLAEDGKGLNRIRDFISMRVAYARL